jgi:hypothetical protein
VDSKGRLTASGNTSIALAGSAITSGTVAIANGGTAASTAETARANLSAVGVFSQDTEPSGGNIGDIWIDTDSAQNTIGVVPRFEGSRITNQSIPNSTHTTVTYPTIVENVGGFIYNAGTITVPLTGRYSFTFNPIFEPNQSGRRFIFIKRNTTTVWQARFEPPGSVGAGAMMASVASERLSGGDILNFDVQQVQGAALNITDARLIIEYLGA